MCDPPRPAHAERRLFVRERHDGLYRVATYLMAKMLDGAAARVCGCAQTPRLRPALTHAQPWARANACKPPPKQALATQ